MLEANAMLEGHAPDDLVLNSALTRLDEQPLRFAEPSSEPPRLALSVILCAGSYGWQGRAY